MLTLLALSTALAADGPDLPPLLQLKFDDEALARLVDDQLTGQEDLSEVRGILASYGVTVTPLHGPQADRMVARAAARSGRAQPDLRGTYRVREPLTEWERNALVAELEDAAHIDWVQVTPAAPPPPADFAPTTPDYLPNQAVHVPASGGLDGPLVQLWSSSVRISDVEYGWETDHEDLEDADITPEPGAVVPGWVASYGWDSHGTAALGELAAVDNGYGTSGLAANARFGTYPEYTNAAGSRRAAAIVSAASDSDPGDLILLEMQTVGALGNYAPAEYDLSVFDATAVAVDAGVIVVAAAGNGAEDLDDPAYAAYHARGDSGAIIVGAGTSNTAHDRLFFSTYGARVNVHAWGENVFTLGYGDYALLGGDERQAYTSVFSGTSSASPIVTGAAAAVSGYAIDSFGAALTPRGVRQVLADTGIAQGSGGSIGPFPDVGAAIAVLDLDADLHASSVYGGLDCDDTDPDISPDATDDTADGIDQNCDGIDGPPMTLTLDPPVVGSPWGWSVSGATPSTNVALIRGRGTGSNQVAGCDIDLDSPKGLDQLTTDALGDGSDDVTLPAQASGKTMWVQALERTTCRVSDPQMVVLP